MENETINTFLSYDETAETEISVKEINNWREKRMYARALK